MLTKKFVIKNEVGLHARPAAVFVQTVSKYKSKITIEKDGKIANAKSIVEVLSLGVEKDAEVTITAEGSDEEDAMRAIEKLIESNFGE
ncbi:MAG: HPr family phosphocarrier protein [Caldisericaceae bacterium]|jgi:phosphocarrier protein|nr:HPr family phosphocarrier protein [Caldisericaceae bacterium]